MGLIRDIQFFDKEDTIYAAKPWSADSRALVLREPASGGLPIEAQQLGLEYFLEIFIACEFIDDWTNNMTREVSDCDICSRLIGYATFDA